MVRPDLLQGDACEITARVRTRECRAVDVLEAQLDEIARLEPHHHVFITATHERACQRAQAVDTALSRGEDPGPLAGVPIAVKDIFDMAGEATTAAMQIHRDSYAERDATVIQRLEMAGALITGKLTLTEGVYAEHREPFPVPVNPWHQDYWPGASSSGSGVAVAAGLSVAALGSETGGSIKLPAASNGVTALKPSWGRVSRHGVFELAASLDHVGPFARSVQDIAKILGVIAGADDNDPTASQQPVANYTAALDDGIEGLRIGIDPEWISTCVDEHTRDALNIAVKQLEDCGADIQSVHVPDVSDMIWDWFPVCAAQTALAHAHSFPAARETYGPALIDLLEMGQKLSATDYQKVLLRREDFRGRMNALLTQVDMLAIPVLAFPVPTLSRMSQVDDDLIAGLHRFTCPFNLSGHPGLVLPCGFNREAMPIVFQLVGQHFDEAKLLRAGYHYQRATDWHLRQPGAV